MTDKELFQQSEKLAQAWESLKVSIDSLAMANTIKQYDSQWCHYFFESQQASNIENNLLNIANIMLSVSNVICPDDFDSSEVD